ncbi:MAG: N-acetylmuramoyl-L-alanine amidase [Clostridiales bacterium]|nr:N-acetylmuramoyl-L-alanine amidase [Clostridiales bacterium]
MNSQDKKYAIAASVLAFGILILASVFFVFSGLFSDCFGKKAKAQTVFLSPSTQYLNLYRDGTTTEGDSMNVIADRLEAMFPEDFTIYRNNSEGTLADAIELSNSLNTEIHVAIHSNASGTGEGGVRGCEIWIPRGHRESRTLAKAVYRHLEKLTPVEDRGLKETESLAELVKVNCTRILIEVDFHDDEDGCEWIKSHYDEIAQAIYDGICDYYGLK